MEIQTAIANGNPDHEETLVVLFLRGGADGLSLVVPTDDDAYYNARPILAVKKEDALDLDGFFGLNPRLERLMRPYDDGALAIVHGAGSEDTTRSHFEAQDFMEHGGLVAGGWLGRFLRAKPGRVSGPLSAIAIGKAMPESLRGAPAAVVIESFNDFSFGEGEAGFATELGKLYGAESGLIGSAGRDTLRAMEKIRALRDADYKPSGDAEYPNDALGLGMRQIAQLIKARVGLEVATIDLPGWDSHFAQSQLINGLMERLAGALAAFYSDLGPALERTTVVALSEFGRRVRENASFGTDHGRAGAMFVMGGGVAGGRVLHSWSGLDRENLEGPGDVPVAFNYRDVLAPILRRHGASSDLATVFPGHAFAPADLYG